MNTNNCCLHCCTLRAWHGGDDGSRRLRERNRGILTRPNRDRLHKILRLILTNVRIVLRNDLSDFVSGRSLLLNIDVLHVLTEDLLVLGGRSSVVLESRVARVGRLPEVLLGVIASASARVATPTDATPVMVALAITTTTSSTSGSATVASEWNLDLFPGRLGMRMDLRRVPASLLVLKVYIPGEVGIGRGAARVPMATSIAAAMSLTMWSSGELVDRSRLERCDGRGGPPKNRLCLNRGMLTLATTVHRRNGRKRESGRMTGVGWSPAVVRSRGGVEGVDDHVPRRCATEPGSVFKVVPHDGETRAKIYGHGIPSFYTRKREKEGGGALVFDERACGLPNEEKRGKRTTAEQSRSMQLSHSHHGTASIKKLIKQSSRIIRQWIQAARETKAAAIFVAIFPQRVVRRNYTQPNRQSSIPKVGEMHASSEHGSSE